MKLFFIHFLLVHWINSCIMPRLFVVSRRLARRLRNDDASASGTIACSNISNHIYSCICISSSRFSSTPSANHNIQCPQFTSVTEKWISISTRSRWIHSELSKAWCTFALHPSNSSAVCPKSSIWCWNYTNYNNDYDNHDDSSSNHNLNNARPIDHSSSFILVHTISATSNGNEYKSWSWWLSTSIVLWR